MEPGSVVDGRFEVVSQVGRGATSVVYRAIDRSSGAHVALKVLADADRTSSERLAREAVLLKNIDDPAIVRCIGHGALATGQAFMALEWLDGETLDQRLKRGRLEVTDALTLATRICEGLSKLHQRGVVHRDIKPGNLFLVGGLVQRAKIIDLNIARFQYADDLAEAGTLLGSPGYLAPEQVRGDADVGPRADLFSLGVVLHECLTGARVFPGEDEGSGGVSRSTLRSTATSSLNSNVPTPLDELVMALLSKTSDLRPPDASHVRSALVALGTGEAWIPEKSHLGRPVLGRQERRVACVVLAHVGADASRRAAVRRARHELRALGAKAIETSDGSALVVMRGETSATDAAVRAARAALALATHLAPTLGGARVVISSGRGVVSGAGLAGEVTERAASMLARARGQGVFIDGVTLGLLGGRFDLAKRGSDMVLVAEREGAGPSLTLLGARSPCVGREAELSRLLAAFDESAERRTAKVALVTAPQGFGKTRLVEELRACLRGSPNVRIHDARGASVGAGAPLALLGSLLRRSLGLDGSEDAPSRESRLLAMASYFSADDPRRTATFLGEVVGLSFSANASPLLEVARHDARVMADQMYRAFEEWLACESDLGPVVLVLDDLQWGDTPSVAFLDRALARLADRPLFVVGVARPEVRDVFPRLWAKRAPLDLELGELRPEAARAIVERALGETAQDAEVDLIVERAQGNAFFLEELIRARASGEGDALPTAVLATVEARLSALPDEKRRVLRAASIFGDEFTADGVAALLGGEMVRVELDRALVDLSAREIVAPHGDDRFVFRHALIREAAYAMLVDADRTLGHRLAAAWLSTGARADASTLAEHFERGGELERSLSHYRDAAQQALDRSDFSAVLVRVERARRAGARGFVLGAFQLLAAEAHRWRAEHDEAEHAARIAAKLLAVGGDAWYGALGEIALASGRLGKLDRLEKVVAQLRTPPKAGLSAAARTRLRIVSALAAIHLITLGRLALADELIDDLVKAGWDDDPAVQARVHQTNAFRSLFEGDPGGYLRSMLAAVAAFERAGDRREACVQLVNVGNASLQLGDYEQAERAVRSSLEASIEMGLENVRAFSLHNLGIVLLRLGKPEEAKTSELEAVDLFAAQGDRRMEGVSRVYLSTILLSMGDAVGAGVEADVASGLLEATPPAKACALASAAAARLAEFDVCNRDSSTTLATADERSREAHALVVSLGGIEEGEALVRLVRAEVLAALGRPDEARKTIEEARARLLGRAERIADAAQRKSFLEQVPENARTIELAAAWTALTAQG